MKTYETEKNNIPEGATHYFNETSCDFFAWWDDVNKLMLTPDRGVGWDNRADCSGDMMHKIPQTKEVEWVNGDSLFYPNSKMVIYIGMDGEYPVVRAWNAKLERFEFYVECEYQLSNKMPETQEDREKREELEAAYDLYCEWNKLLGHDSIRHISTFKDDDNYALFRFFVAHSKNLI